MFRTLLVKQILQDFNCTGPSTPLVRLANFVRSWFCGLFQQVPCSPRLALPDVDADQNPVYTVNGCSAAERWLVAATDGGYYRARFVKPIAMAIRS